MQVTGVEIEDIQTLRKTTTRWTRDTKKNNNQLAARQRDINEWRREHSKIYIINSKMLCVNILLLSLNNN